jgi:hypothetical protein
MKKVVRWMPVLSLLAVMIGAALPVVAQDSPNPLCNGLSDDDCQMLVDAQANLDGVTSFTVPAWSIGFKLETLEQKASFDAKGSGAFSMTSDTDFVIHLVIDDASMESEGETQSGSAEVIVTPEKVYLLYGDEWYADDLSAENLDSLGLGSLAGAADMLGSGEDGSLLSMEFLGITGIDLTNVVTTTRGDDMEGMAVFSTDVDLAGLLVAVLSSPGVGELMGMTMGDSTSELPAMSPEDIQMLAMFIQPMFEETTIVVEEWVNPEDMMLHGLKADIVLNVDASLLVPEVGKVAGEFHFMTGMDDFNEPVEVTLPENTKPLSELEDTLNELTGGLGL